jgi:type II secretory pathway component PulK
MKRLVIPAFAAVALFAVVATAMLWSHSTKLSAGTAAMPSLQELHTVAGVNKLPNQEIEDQSLIFPSRAKR